MALRERIRKAIEEPVGQADRRLDELGGADAEAKLEILISGWGRGLSAALEELAIAIDDLQTRLAAAFPRDDESRSPPRR